MTSAGPLPSVPSKTDQVHDRVRDRILSGQLRPGERLSMDALARELGVSKIPVREAIGRLAAAGLVESHQHSGPSVARIDAAQLRGAYLAREALEPVIARLAAQRAHEHGTDELEAAHEAMTAAVHRDDRAALGDHNARFHAALARLSGYDVLAEVSERLLLAVRRYRVVDPLSIDNWQSVLGEHESILEAVRAGDAAAAEQAATRHATSQAGHDRAGTGVSDDR